MSRAPRGPTRVAPSVSAAESVETALGGLESTAGIFTSPGEVAPGGRFDLGDLDRGEIPGAPEPGQVHGITAVGLHAVGRVVRNPGGGHDSARLAWLGQVALAPRPTGTGCIDHDERLGLGWELAAAGSDVPRTRANGPARGDLRTLIVGDRGDRQRGLMDRQANVECASVTPG